MNGYVPEPVVHQPPGLGLRALHLELRRLYFSLHSGPGDAKAPLVSFFGRWSGDASNMVLV